MIWKNLGFQASVVAAVVALIAFVAPLPGERAKSPPNATVTPVHDTSAVSVQSTRPPAVEDNSAGPVENTTPTSNEWSSHADAAGPLWSPGPEHDARENAAHHWQKHGGEFSELHSERDYTNAAHDFVNHPPPGAQTKQDSRGNTLIYDPESNTFAVKAPDGAPRTMFRPHNGRAYWDRQH
jgi:pyocin large subunit-like protein